MIQLPCPYCNITIRSKAETKAKSGLCPQCRKRVYPLEFDDTDIAETFPFVRWAPCDDGRSSIAHVQLARCGLNGTHYFLVNDPAIEGWWKARRKGLRPCRCTEILVDKWDAEKLKLPRKFVKSLSFDPWSSEDDCELMGWGSGDQIGWPDSNYANHPGNPDLKDAKEEAEWQRTHPHDEEE